MARKCDCHGGPPACLPVVGAVHLGTARDRSCRSHRSGSCRNTAWLNAYGGGDRSGRIIAYSWMAVTWQVTRVFPKKASDSGPHCLSAHQVCAQHTHFPGSAIICARAWGIYPQAHWTLLDSQAALSEARRLPQLKVLGLVQRTGAPAGEALVLAPAHFRGCARLIMHFWV